MKEVLLTEKELLERECLIKEILRKKCPTATCTHKQMESSGDSGSTTGYLIKTEHFAINVFDELDLADIEEHIIKSIDAYEQIHDPSTWKPRLISKSNLNSNMIHKNLGHGLVMTYHSNIDDIFVPILNLDSIGCESLEELHEQAMKNMENDILIDNVSDVLDIPFTDDSFPLLRVTNKNQQYGAACIYSEKTKQALDSEFPHGYLMIPSSVHEFLIMPDINLSTEFIPHIIVTINLTLNQSKILGYRPYEYEEGTTNLI